MRRAGSDCLPMLMASEPPAGSTPEVTPVTVSGGEPIAQKATTSDVAVVVLTASLWPLGVVAMLLTKGWSLGSKVAAIGVVIVVG